MRVHPLLPPCRHLIRSVVYPSPRHSHSFCRLCMSILLECDFFLCFFLSFCGYRQKNVYIVINHIIIHHIIMYNSSFTLTRTRTRTRTRTHARTLSILFSFSLFFTSVRLCTALLLCEFPETHALVTNHPGYLAKQ